MKDIDVSIRATFEIPDDWAVVEFRCSDEGDTIEVVRADDHYCFFTIRFLFDALPGSHYQTNCLKRWIGNLKSETCNIVEPLKPVGENEKKF